MIHTWTHVYLNDPRIQVLVDHKVIANHLKESSFASNTTFTSLDTPNNNIFNFFLNNFPLFFSNKLTKSLHIPHTLINNSSFMIFLNRIIRQMHKFIMNIVKTIVITTKSKITLLIKPYYRRIVILD